MSFLTTSSRSDMVAADSAANTLTKIPFDSDKATFLKWKRFFIAFAGSNKYLDGLIEIWRNPVFDPGAEPAGDDAVTLHQKNLWQHRSNAFSVFQEKQDVSRAKAWQHLIYICEGNSTLEELVNSHESKDILLRNKDLWQAICDEYEVHAEISTAAAPCLELFKIQYEDTGNSLTDFKILVAKIDKIAQDCARNGIDLDDKIKLAKLQDALSYVQSFDELQVLSVLEGATTYADFVRKIKTASGVQFRISKSRPSILTDKTQQHQEDEQSGLPAGIAQLLSQLDDTDDPLVKSFASYIKKFKPYKSTKRPGAKFKKGKASRLPICSDCEGQGHKSGDPRCTFPICSDCEGQGHKSGDPRCTFPICSDCEGEGHKSGDSRCTFPRSVRMSNQSHDDEDDDEIVDDDDENEDDEIDGDSDSGEVSDEENEDDEEDDRDNSSNDGDMEDSDDEGSSDSS